MSSFPQIVVLIDPFFCSDIMNDNTLQMIFPQSYNAVYVAKRDTYIHRAL